MRRNFKKKAISILLSAALVLAAFTACGGSSSASSAASSSAPASSSEAAPTATPEATPTPTPEPDFMTANSLTYSDPNDLPTLQIPIGNYVTDENHTPVIDHEGITVVPQTGTYSFTGAAVTAPDENGMVTYTITADVNFPCLYDYTEDCPIYYFNAVWSSYFLMDAYTGIEFPDRELTGDDSFEVSTDVTWDGETYSVSYSKAMEYEYYDEGQDYLPDGTYEYYCENCAANTITIHCPQGYNGCVIAVRTTGMDEAGAVEDQLEMAEEGNEIEEAKVFEPKEGCTMDDYVFYHLSDIMALFTTAA